MPRRYASEFPRKVLDLVDAGKPIAQVASELGVTDQTIYNWGNQELIDRGLRPGGDDAGADRVGGGPQPDPRA